MLQVLRRGDAGDQGRAERSRRCRLHPALGVVLLLVAGLEAAAGEPPPSLLGEWIVAGSIDLDTRTLGPPEAEERIELRRDVVLMTGAGEHVANYCTWAVDAHGIGLDLHQADGSVLHASLLILPDGLVIQEPDRSHAMVLKRADGAPPGLPPSPWPQRSAPAAAAAGAATLIAGDFTASANALRVERSIDYPVRAGDALIARDEVSFSLIVKTSRALLLAAAERAALIEASTDLGEDLLPSALEDTVLARTLAHQSAAHVRINEGAIYLDFPLRLPAREAKELARLRGTVTVRYEATPGTTSDLAQPRTLIGTRQQIVATGLGLTITAITDDEVVLAADTALLPLIKECQFLDDAGNPLDDEGPSTRGAREQDAVVEQHYGVRLPAHGAIRLRLFGALREVTVPFILEHLPLLPTPPAVAPPHRF